MYERFVGAAPENGEQTIANRIAAMGIPANGYIDLTVDDMCNAMVKTEITDN
jgi:hypothetical protein